MAFITQRTINEILSTARIEDVVDDFVSLKRRGVNMIGNCPFHNEKTPSFTVSPSKNVFKCFGCGKGGDSVRFIMEHEGMNYPESLRYLAAKYNIKVEEEAETNEAREERQLADSLYLINEYAKNYFKDKMMRDPRGKAVGYSYFKERGFLMNTVENFELGYATDAWDGFTKEALERGYKIEYLQMLGLTTHKKLDFFRDRVMFPIHNIAGKVIAFAGRIMNNDKTQPKYINSPESEIYNKRKVLYGLFQAKNTIRKENNCYLVEGYTDVISMHQAGIHNVVASSGTALTEEQVSLLRRYTPNVTLIYDGDSAGISAALRGTDIILEQDLNVKLVLLPDGEDPDSFMKKLGFEGFNEFVHTEGKDFVLFKAKYLLGESGDDPIKKTEVLKDILASISKIPDALKRNLYVTECSKILNVDEKLLSAELLKQITRLADQKRKEAEREKLRENREKAKSEISSEKIDEVINQLIAKPAVSAEEVQERELVKILFNYGEKFYHEEEGITMADFLAVNIEDYMDSIKNKAYAQVFRELLGLVESGATFSYQHFLHHRDQIIQDLYVELITSPFQYASWEEKGVFLQTQKKPEENFVTEAIQVIKRFRLKKLNSTILELNQLMKQSADTAEEQFIQMEAMKMYLTERNELANELNQTVL
jgi:DNA primase